MGNIVEKAIKYATEKHSGQKRKDGTIYVLHPLEVVTIASSITNDEEVLAAATLHDVIEECDIDIKEITNIFGNRVSKIVALETEPKYPELSKDKSWQLRKEEAIRRLNNSDDIGFKIVYLSDKLANIRSLFKDFNMNGLDALNKFNIRDKDMQAWYYFSVLEAVKELNKHDAYKELEDKVKYIFKDYERK